MPIGKMNRRSFARGSARFAGTIAIAACVQESKVEAAINSEKLSAAIKRLRGAVQNIAADVDKLYDRQPKVYVPDFPGDLTALRTAYDDLLVATGHEDMLKDAP